MRATEIHRHEPAPARERAVRNGIPFLVVKSGARPVTLTLVNRLRDEPAGRTGRRQRDDTARDSPPLSTA